VLSSANGCLDAKVLFIAEAPGRLGADRTGVPLHGDRTGENFETLLRNIGWRRDQVFITNAILCNPREENGNNDTPSRDEIANCSAYVEMVIALVDPQVVVTLGATALESLEMIAPHGLRIKEGVARPVPWLNRCLFPLYHPAPRAAVHRSLANQRADFMRLAKIVDPTAGLIERKPARPRKAVLFPIGTTPLEQVARTILELGGQMTYFKLTKLLYLVDLFAQRKLGHTVASEIYLRQAEGPWPPALNDALTAMNGYEVRRLSGRVPVVAPGPSPRATVQLDDDILEIVGEVFGKYGGLSNSQIKTTVYGTEPMRCILREENKGKDMRNKPVLYRDRTAVDFAKDSEAGTGKR
jgi:uracil-DNA glycosylase family 4